jgi:hypothetical protein
MFVHSERDVVGVVQGDDFVWEGTDDNLDRVLKVLEAEYEPKNCGRLGLGERDVREIDMLGRVIQLDSEGISWKGDPRHRNLIFDYFGMNSHTKALTKNGYEDDGTHGGKCDDTELNKEKARRFRKLAAGLNYMAQDTPLLQFPKYGPPSGQRLRGDEAARAVHCWVWGGGVQVRLAEHGQGEGDRHLRGQ